MVKHRKVELQGIRLQPILFFIGTHHSCDSTSRNGRFYGLKAMPSSRQMRMPQEGHAGKSPICYDQPVNFKHVISSCLKKERRESENDSGRPLWVC